MPARPAIDQESAQQALRESADSVLETMFFALAELAPARQRWPGPMIPVEMCFKGIFEGSFVLEIESCCALELAVSALGLDGGMEPSGEQLVQLACELANMLCGNTLGRLEPTLPFDLSEPKLRGEQEGAVVPDGNTRAERWLQTESGLLHLTLEMQGIA
jgi:CheY-specific phosphatase CheX